MTDCSGRLRSCALRGEGLRRARIVAAVGLQDELDGVARDAAAIAMLFFVGLAAEHRLRLGEEGDLSAFDFAFKDAARRAEIRSGPDYLALVDFEVEFLVKADAPTVLHRRGPLARKAGGRWLLKWRRRSCRRRGRRERLGGGPCVLGVPAGGRNRAAHGP